MDYEQMFADSHVLGHWYYMQLVNCLRKLDKNHTSWASVIVLGRDLFSLFETPRSVPNAGKTKQNTSFFGNNSLCVPYRVYIEKKKFKIQQNIDHFFQSSILFCFYFIFWDRFSCSWGWPWSLDLPASSSKVEGLYMYNHSWLKFSLTDWVIVFNVELCINLVSYRHKPISCRLVGYFNSYKVNVLSWCINIYQDEFRALPPGKCT